MGQLLEPVGPGEVQQLHGPCYWPEQPPRWRETDRERDGCHIIQTTLILHPFHTIHHFFSFDL